MSHQLKEEEVYALNDYENSEIKGYNYKKQINENFFPDTSIDWGPSQIGNTPNCGEKYPWYLPDKLAWPHY